MFNHLMMACAFYLLTGLLAFWVRIYWWVYYSPEDFDINKSNRDILLPSLLWPIFFACMIVDYVNNILNKEREERINKQKGIGIRPYWWESEDKDGYT